MGVRSSDGSDDLVSRTVSTPYPDRLIDPRENFHPILVRFTLLCSRATLISTSHGVVHQDVVTVPLYRL